ncbi:hypothetical protein WDU94_000608 [Cyamophila willieti]
MMFKKGDHMCPANYRGIALINTLTKLFTQILTNRFMDWMEKENLFCEGQAGFRRGRSCLDNIFVLMALIQLHLRTRGSKLYAAFVDYRTAFDVINRNRLWQKLYNLGVSSKFIRILQSLYEKTTCKIKVNDIRSTNAVKVNKGLWQGDSYSPAAFAAYINDMEEYMIRKGYRGINIDGRNEIILLLFADDLIILADSKIDLQKKLETLKEYSDENLLTVNTGKTKVMIFRSGGRLNVSDTLYYDGEPLENVNKFTYLGVTFSSSGTYSVAAENMLSKTRAAIATVKHMFIQTKVDSWDARIKLYEAIIRSTLMYGCEVWGVAQLDVMEKAQNEFFKNLLYLAKCTPGYMIRQETGVSPIKLHAIDQILNWIVKLENMACYRYPAMCYKRLLDLHKRGVLCKKGNWVSQVSKRIEDVGIDTERLWDRNEENNNKKMEDIKEFMKLTFLQEDKERCTRSSYSNVYSEIKSNETVEKYLTCRVHIENTRLVAQARMGGRFIYFYVQKKAHYWKEEEMCRRSCEMEVQENMEHFLVQCPKYENLRKEHLSHIPRPITLVKLLCIEDIKQMYKLTNYIKQVILQRQREVNMTS